ncbi:hypothetical protein FSP39_003363 [Pinctada imbricata]|uniref:Helicase C-terminal domain-containing protein n=1 Tax=Pinctada imbricata TaxID=66713 RepID=A0AA88YHC6_PINIB|nr:hypothetical protein FSP39_003363 [Pinctada imbricata]
MFERPITNGQCHDSTQGDEKLMRYRAHVLHSLLEGFVQRRGHTVLRDALPPKQEFIFMIRMSPIQKKLYKEFMDSLMGAGLGTWASNNPLKAFAVCCKIWNHPDILHNLLNKRNAGTDDNDLDIETEGGPAKKPKAPKKPRVPQPVDAYYPPNDRNQEINYDWAKDLMKDYMSGLLEQGGKMVILMKLIEESLACNDKILVFSQSLFTLDLIEEFLSKYKVPRPDMDENWAKNRSYFRLDGSTSAQEREKLINQFNAPDNNRCWLFLLSTRAGSLGVNLVGANRVVVVDASWNPCHDCQAICRIYRFGQVKPCFIYRLVTDNTMEKKIYDRQVTKQGMSNRVVDEMQVQSHFSRRQVDNLLQFEDQDFDEVDFSGAEEEYIDPVMINVLQKEGKWLTKKPFEHESLLIDKKELRLTKKEKAIAKQSYVMEKRLNVSYTRPSYAAFYPKGTEPMRRPQIKIVNPTNMSNWPSFPGRPVASVKPMISTPVPMQIKRDGTAAGIMVSKNKPGVSVHKVVTTTDIMLPGTSTSTQAGVTKSEPNKIPAGQQIFIIKTPKGVYIRTAAGKIFAVRAKFPLLGTLGAGTAVTTSTTSTVTTAEVNTATTSSISSSASASSPSSSSWEPGSEPKTITSTATTTSTTTLTSSVVTDASKHKDADSFLSSALDKPSNSVKKQDSSNSLVSMSTNVTCSTTDSIRRQDSTASLISGLNKVTDSFRREDSSSSLASTLNAADILGDKESDEDSKSNEINFPSSDSLLDLDSKSVKKAASKGKPSSDRTLNQEKEMASIEPKSTNMEMSAANSEMKSANTEMNFTNTEMNFANKEINLANTEMSPTNTELNSMNEMPMEMASKMEDVQSRYQKIAPNLASFGAQMGMDNNQMMQAPNNMGSHNEMPMNDRYQTKNMESFSAQLGLHNDQGMPQTYNNYGPPMGGANDMMQNNPYQMPSMNHNNMMSLPYLYQNQMIYNPPPPYPSGANNQSPYGNSGGYSDQMGGMPQNQMRDNINTSMQNNSMQNTSMPNSSMQSMGMPGMASMGMPMQHSMLGFPFAPYPFPMPQPYLMGGMDRSYMSHMQMGQGGGYMPQGMGHMPQSHMGMGMPQQNTMNISNFQHGNGGSVSSVSNTTNMSDNTGNQ